MRQIIKRRPPIKINDRIEGDTIYLHDNIGPRPGILKRVVIIKPSGSRREFEIKKTRKEGYLFN